MIDRLVSALVTFDPFPTGPELAKALDVTLYGLWPILESAIEAGSIEQWPESLDGTARYAPSPWTLATLGLELEEDHRGRWHWRRVGTPDKPVKVRRLDDQPTWDERPSNIPGPLDHAIKAEKAERAETEALRRLVDQKVKGTTIPRPARLLGSSIPWNGPVVGPCPVCSGLALPPSSFCLACERSSVDALLPRRPRKPTTATPKLNPEKVRRIVAKLKGGVGRANVA